MLSKALVLQGISANICRPVLLGFSSTDSFENCSSVATLEHLLFGTPVRCTLKAISLLLWQLETIYHANSHLRVKL